LFITGTICVLVILVGTKILCANVGDSRAIMITSYNEIIELSKDHKPNVPKEMKRILNKGGRVFQCEINGVKKGPFRIWKKTAELPGLAMSRTIGDGIAKEIGVTSKPDIIVK
jgi:serine/threonine protein phosphatase PrpC